jgi:hypothetical protein
MAIRLKKETRVARVFFYAKQRIAAGDEVASYPESADAAGKEQDAVSGQRIYLE